MEVVFYINLFIIHSFTRGKEITKNKKTECLRREGYISPMCGAYPLYP